MNDKILKIKKSTLVDIADQVRAKTGSTDKIKVKDLDDAIATITGGDSNENEQYIGLDYHMMLYNADYDISNTSLNNLADIDYYAVTEFDPETGMPSSLRMLDKAEHASLVVMNTTYNEGASSKLPMHCDLCVCSPADQNMPVCIKLSDYLAGYEPELNGVYATRKDASKDAFYVSNNISYMGTISNDDRVTVDTGVLANIKSIFSVSKK